MSEVSVKRRRNQDEGRASIAVVVALGLLVGLLAYIAADVVSVRWVTRPDIQNGPLLALVSAAVLVACSVLLAWAQPRVSLVAGLLVTCFFVFGQLIWTPQYLDLDVWSYDPVAFLAFGSQQLLIPALASALIVISGLKVREQGAVSRSTMYRQPSL
jgi:hypothetical protein